MVTESFGAKQLEKYGWEKGKGLGANEDGMSSAIKPTLKFDKHGLGHDIVKDIAFNWWDGVFNKALDDTGRKEFNAIKPNPKKRKTYSNFVKSGERDSDPEDVVNPESVDTLSDEMVNICEGRTAHKGARHGVYSSSKLERLKKAEAEFLEQYSLVDPKPKIRSKKSTKRRTKRLN